MFAAFIFLLCLCGEPEIGESPQLRAHWLGRANVSQEPTPERDAVPFGLADLAEEVNQLQEQRVGAGGALELLEDARLARDRAETFYLAVKQRFQSTQRRMDAAGLTDGMGEILRRDAAWLPDPEQQARNLEALEVRLSAAQILAIDHEEGLSQSIAFGSDERQVLEALKLDANDDALRSAVEILLENRNVFAHALEEDLSVLVSTLSEALSLSAAAGDLAMRYRAFIEKKVLWVRSSSRGLLSIPVGALRHLGEVIENLRGWSPLESWNRAEVRVRAVWILSAFLIVIVFARRKGLRAQRRLCNQQIQRHDTDGFSPSVKVLLIALALAVPWPLLLWVVGSMMELSRGMAVWSLGQQLCLVAWIWYGFRFLFRCTEPEGLARTHFHWNKGEIGRLHLEFRLLEPIALLCIFFTFPTGTTEWHETLGRLSLALLMGVLSFFGWRFFRAFKQDTPQASSLQEGKQEQISLITRALPLWQGLAVVLPLLLSVAAISGYVFAAERLAGRLAVTLVFVLFLFLVQGFLIRWLQVARRRLAVAQALQARDAKHQAQRAETVEGVSDLPAPDLDHLDIPSLDAQSRQLFRSGMTLATVIGLFWIWGSVLPAVGDLNRFEVWPQFGQILEPETNIVSASEEIDVPQETTSGIPLSTGPLGKMLTAGQAEVTPAIDVLTLDELVWALVLLAVTLLFAKNIPALLELTVLQRLPLDNGTRYAATTLVRYMVLLVGLGMVSGALGVGWHQVQWLAAALTFGLAFGLQEIFANFVSGLIILFERPIRVGDIVTVGDKEGRVMQLRMRATTIQDWDRREMLVPNKEFITQRITNWTLSDPVTRIVIPVGIAYGSDTDLARRTLLACANEEPLVLKTPPPHAVFRAFGESSLDFQLRVFIENPENWPAMVDRMHQRIDGAFREHGIEIAFPQRDVHLRHVVPNKPGETEPRDPGAEEGI